MGHPSLPPAVIEMQTLNKFSLKQNSMWNILTKNFMESPPRFLSKIIKTRFVEPNVIKCHKIGTLLVIFAKKCIFLIFGHIFSWPPPKRARSTLDLGLFVCLFVCLSAPMSQCHHKKSHNFFNAGQIFKL